MITLLLQCHAAMALNQPSIGRKEVLRAVAAAAAVGCGKPSLVAAKSGIALPTNEVVSVVEGISQKRLGGGDIIVSEGGLGTQRWGSTDYNGPDQAACHAFMDRAILEGGVNLIDTAEQYPIPSGVFNPEGYTEEIIGSWLKQDPARRRKVVIASKITGAGVHSPLHSILASTSRPVKNLTLQLLASSPGADNINQRSIMADCEASLKRLGTDYLDLYLLHWPARYTPQSNWGQSLEFNRGVQVG